MSRNKRHSERGAAIIELALVIPFLVLSFAGIFQFNEMMGETQIIAQVSREAANVVFRTCRPTGVNVAGCLNTATADLQLYLNERIPGSEMIVTMYQRTPVTGTINSVQFQHPVAGAVHTSRYDDSTIDATLSSLNDENTWVVVAEVFADAGRDYRILDISLIPVDTLYEVTVY